MNKMKIGIAMLFLSIASASAQTNFIFLKLLNESGETVMTNAEFRSIVGRKVIFKQTDTGKLKSFDIESVNQQTLSDLGIDSSAAIRKQAEIDAAKAKAAQVYREQSIIAGQRAAEKLAADTAALKERRKQEAIAAREQALASEIQREKDLIEAQRVADIEATRAETKRLKAAAGYLNRTP